ncbi:replication endonuclease [Billgrantia gudaonensis]|uniref:Bacteriophage replication gene A protein (GPA) n=1 Tax=Billgrantia gudaonensis TaxID=376427 RepID=A0A1G9E325_9GAMM|nr:replication endonuclease [Halomonas gudaonensis]SDK70545.1 Bacteriophage replication gene A protein (GPA) [Halomonas gudaonensis]
MTALERSLQFGNRECHAWRQAHYWSQLPSIAEDLAAGFVYVARRHGNAAGNRWLRRNAAGLIEPARVYRKFRPIAADLERGFRALVHRAPTTIEGLRAGCEWLASVEARLSIGAFNCTHDDDALVNHAEAQARAIEHERNALIGSIAEHNRRQRLGLLPPPVELPPLQGETLSARVREKARLIAESRNALTPPPVGIPLMAVFTWQRTPTMSLAVADELALRKARTRARLHGITPPPVKGPAAVQLARLTCSQWWRRKLRRLAGRRLEQVQREAHRVHAQAGIYCSDLTVERRKSQKARNRALLETLEAINQEGQTYTLAELAELGLANPDHRRAELMLRIRDTEAEARRLGHRGMFYTVTAPSRFHPAAMAGKKKVRRNPHYDGSSPREAQQHLQALWAKVRAKLARDDVGVYGIRVVEPNHDGTPHWHLLVWMQPEHEPAVTRTLQEYAEAEAPEELFDRFGRKTEARFKAKRIDHSNGRSAAGYVAKYISKNINGQQFARDGVAGDEKDPYGRNLSTIAPRIEAWAAVWGIRQFQFFGLPSVTVWREVRRLTERQERHLAEWEAATRPVPTAAERFHAIRKAANAGQWDLFLRLMGGPNRPRKERPIKPWTVHPQDTGRAEFSHATGQMAESLDALGRYGEPLAATWGLVVTDGRGREAEYLTRVYRWEVRSRHPSRAEGSSGPGAAGAPWTCVTNCTGVDIRPRTPPPEVLERQLERFRAWRASEEVRAVEEDAEFEARMIRAAARRLFQPTPPPQPEEYFPPELC